MCRCRTQQALSNSDSEQSTEGYEMWFTVAAVETTVQMWLLWCMRPCESSLWSAIIMPYELAKPCQTVVVSNSVTPASLPIKWRVQATATAHTSCTSPIARLQFSNSSQSYEPRYFLFLQFLRMFVCFPLNPSTIPCYILTDFLQHTLAETDPIL